MSIPAPQRFISFLIVSIMVASAPGIAVARTALDSLVERVAQLYDAGSYLSAELEGRRSLEQGTIADSVRMQLEKYIAFSLVAQDKPQSAVSHFSAMLQIDSTFNLDPQLTSPKILSVFQQTREKYFNQRTQMIQQAIPHRESSGVTFRTIIFPGWEQLYQGRMAVGYTFLAVGGASLLSTIYCEFRRHSARSSYLNATSTESAVDLYKTYNNFQKAEIYSAAIFVAGYILSEVDVYTHRTEASEIRASLRPGFNSFQASLTIVF